MVEKPVNKIFIEGIISEIIGENYSIIFFLKDETINA
jgi:hypothetical protein